jgi:hypothetical protein
MWQKIKQWIARYHAHQARYHFKRHRYALALHYLQSLEKWDSEQAKQPVFVGYLAMCHYQLKYWENLAEEVERALFVLRRHIKTDKEALLIWQDLKSHLADLRYIDNSNSGYKQASGHH